jgi:hypothetical protein
MKQLVSAAGFEPATHALKDHRIWGLPRILNHLRSPQTSQNALEGWQAGLN